MKRTSKILSAMIAVLAAFVMTACGANGGKDEWNGVQVFNNSLVKTDQVQSGISNPPTVICDITTKATLDKVTNGETKPASVIVRLNEKFNVVDAQGKLICSFSSLYDNVIKGKIVPIIYLSDADDAQRAIELFTKRYDLLDAAVMSDDPTCVKTVRAACPKIRGIVEFDELADAYDAVRIPTANLSTVAVIPQSAATVENVFYIQSRFKTVWVRLENNDRSTIYDAVNSGAYGIVSENFASVVDTLCTYEDNSITRMPFVAAHRGLPNAYNENSVSGCRAAVAAGATHVEIDGYLTRDNRIAIMHDYTIDRTSDGEGVIEDRTLDELQKFDLDLYEPHEPIPSLDDILEAIKDTDVVLIFEIKSQKIEIVNALKTALETHKAARQVVVLTSHSKILTAMSKVLPDIPTASLTAVSEDSLEDALSICCSYNTIIDAPFDSVTPAVNAALRDRGLVGWYWTYDTVSDMTEAVKLGYTGLTTNVADEFVKGLSEPIVFAKISSDVSSVPAVGADISLVGVTYSGTEKEINGKVFYAEDVGDRYAVVARFSGIGSTVNYTQTYYIEK